MNPVTIIIPVYNASKYLRECLDSVVRQSFTDFELIIVDDGSTDDSFQICNEYARCDQRIRLIRQANQGQSAARNTGLDAADGRFVTFLDADDLLHPEYLSILMRFANDDNIVLCSTIEGTNCTWQEAVKRGDRSLCLNKLKQSDLSPRFIEYQPIDAIENTLYQDRLLPSIWGKIYPAKIFERNRFVSGLWYEDLDLIYQLYEAISGKVIYVDLPLHFYRNNPTSFINTFNTKRLDVLKVVDKIEAHYADNPKLLRAAHDRKFSANCNMFILTAQAGMSDVAAACWSVIKSYRAAELNNSKVRLKNKLGALLSYSGKRAFLLASKALALKSATSSN